MRFFVSLGRREFPLSLETRNGAGRASVAVSSGAALEAEILCASEQGRPALVSVDGHMFRVRLDGHERSLGGSGNAGRFSSAVINGHCVQLEIETELERRARPNRVKSAAAGTKVRAPMPGRVVKVDVRAGDTVLAGAPLLSIEAMKMENELMAPNPGRVARVLVSSGDTVDADQELVVIEPG
jgi:glutaconyl-CoA/methylmalonyl-CoA decarboxylase subunit gamma